MPNSQVSAASKILPLSSVQEVIWLDQCLYPDTPIYNIGLAWHIRGQVDAALLERAVNQVANANDALRTVLRDQDSGLPLQQVLPAVQVTVAVRDFDEESAAAAYMQARFARPFDLFGGLLWSTELVRVGDTCYWLQCYHHLVNDGYGAYIAMHAVARAYNALLAGTALAEEGPSYQEFVADDTAYRQSARYERDRQFWSAHYAQLPEALFDRSGVDARGQVAPNARVCWNMPRAQFAQLEAYAAGHGASPTHCLMAALAAWFARAQGKEEVVIGVPVHNRANAQYKRTVGMFSSISPVRVRVDRDASFSGLLAEVMAELKRGYRHQRFPIAELNRAAGLAQAGRQQLYDITVTTMNFDGIAHFGDASTRIVPMHHGVERTPLVLSIRDHHVDGDVLLEFVCNTGVLSQEQVASLQAGLARMLTAAQQDAALPVARLPMMGVAEESIVLQAFNSTAAPLPREQLVHQLFETQAAAQPDAVAVLADDGALRYGELDAQANRVAHALRARGVQPGDRVAICLERSSSLLAGLLGILKAGAAYVPLDPAFPAERLAYMVEDSAPAALLTQSALAAVVAAPGVPRLLLDADASFIGVQPATAPALSLSPSQLAYVIYTSGSTGLPKGVMVEHGSVLNFLASMAREPGLQASDTLLAVTTLSFDIAGLELFLPLSVGARVVLASRATASDAGALAQAIAAHGASVMQATPATWRMLLAAGWQGAPGLKVLCGGEALPADLSQQLQQAVGELWNVYGPTETTIWSTCRRVRGACDGVAEAIGRPIANTQVYVLDAQLQPVPLGAAGELYIGGAGVARGYLDRAELTAERFVADPFSAERGARMYKTGDLARWRADGQLEYLGRNDFQVKVRGFRIELGEIETRLAACAGVRQAVVAAREDTPGDQRLVAYLLAEAGSTLDMGALRATLLEQLPDYMVPSAFMQLEAFPLTPNKKLDRKALPAPDAQAVIQREYEAPQGAAEEAIAAVWQELLGVQRIGRRDHFFELGGHSLLAVQAIGRLRQALGRSISLRTLFDNPTPAQLAKLAAQEAAADDAIAVLPRGGMLPLSFAQQRLWFLDQLQPEASLAYHMPGALHLQGPLDRAALRAALNRIVARHESLRTCFTSVDGEPQQLIEAEDAGFPLLELDLSVLAEADRASAIEHLAADEARRPFDLAQGPLVRAQLLKLGEFEHKLLVTQHHIVSDAWSVGVLLGEVRTLYCAFSQGLADPLPPLALQYADYAAWQRSWLQGARAETQLNFWQQHLAGAPALLELPTDRPRQAVQSHRGARLQFDIPAGLADALRALAQRHGATLFMTLFAGWSALLARLSGQDDIVIGVPVANRPRAELEPLIGFFVNTLALRVQLGEDDTASQLLEQVKASTLAAWENQDLPFDQVVEAVQPVRSMSYAPLFQVMFSLNNTPVVPDASGALTMKIIEHHNASTQLDLVLAINETPDGLAASLVYATDLFDAPSAERLAAQYCRVLEAMAADAAQAVRVLPLLDDAERRQLLVDFNDSAVAREAGLAHPLFEAHAAADPDALAVVYKDEEVSYGALNERANRLAHRLLQMGVRPDDRIAICVERGIDMVICVLGVLKAGACYLPLDPGYPDERLGFMLGDSAPAALLTHASLANSLPHGDVPLLVLDAPAEQEALAQQPAHNPDPAALGLRPDHLAYVIYTSGSTGQPKGAMNRHRGLNNLAAAQRTLFAVDGSARVLQFASFSFDASVWEMAMALFNGATLYLEPKRALLPGETFIDTLRRHGITHATLPSSLVATIPADAELPLRCLVMAGEACPPPLASRWADRMAVFNAYGPTETTVCASVFRCHGGHLTSVPIGRPLANMQLYILDRRMQPVPLGVTGELYIGGEGLARGYLNRPDLNAERFVADPFSDQRGARLYKTGDLARWLPDGTVDYIGRNDFQVKLRGFRIELGEIEARLTACAGVREAVVMVREDQPGNRRLVAYVVAQDGVPLSSAALRTELTEQLAEFMVPSAFVMLDALPLTPNGKVERRALPAPGADAVVARAYVAPKGPLELAMAAVWQELLDLPRVGRYDNFFELGGHSLMAVQVVARLRQELGVELGLRDLFSHPVLHECAALAHGGEELPPIAAARRDAPLPLSFPQQRLWFIDRLDRRAGAAYHIAGALRLRGTLNRAALQAALDRIVARHEGLRTTFHERDGQACQLVGSAGRGFALSELSLAHLDGEAQDAALAAACASEAAQLFDLAQGPLVRGCLVGLGEDDHMLLLTQHHIVSDGWSTGLLVGELNTLYAAFAAGEPDPLPALALQYGDFAAWQQAVLHRDALAHQAAYWSAHLDGAPALLELPTDRPRPALQSHAGGHVPLALDASLAGALRALGQRHGATLYMVLFAAWAALLSRLGGQPDVVIGTPVAGRSRPELEKLIGFFVNSLAVRVRLDQAPSVAALLQQVRDSLLAAYEHQDLPFDQLVELLQPQRSMAHAPLFQAVFSMNNTPAGHTVQLPGLSVTDMSQPPASTQFDLVLMLEEQAGAVGGYLGFASDLFDAATAQRLAAYFTQLLVAMAADDTQAVESLPLMDAPQRKQLLQDFNASAIAYPRDSLVHTEFERWAATTPDAIALDGPQGPLSYAELNRRANRLAHHLIGLGVRADDRVAICAERSVDVVVGLLGILKAGAGYVPLDPAYPAERLALMLDDCAPAAVLAQAAHAASLPPFKAPLVLLDGADAAAIAAQPEHNPDAQALGLHAQRLAYVIYTSGSTGVPNGVQVEHRNVLRLAVGGGFAPIAAGDCLAHCASPSFDASTWELWGALLQGARVLLVPQEVLLSAPRLNAALLQGGVTHMWLTVGLFNEYVDALEEAFGQLRYLMIGGDALDPHTVRRALSKARRPQHLVNGYGPTETTTFAATFDIAAVPAGARSLPIGGPIGNTQLYILDSRMQPVPLGAPGELYIGGDGVARGYLKRDALSAERFVANPFGAAESRLYKTGDLARWLPDGTVDFLGRNDQQVKIRGFRIEPGEIEARLAALDGVREAVVLAREDVPGEKRLVAYVVAEQGVQLDAATLRTALASQLAAYMVPAAIMLLEAFPLTANGKLDRRALPAPDRNAIASTGYEAPQGGTEQAIAGIWQELLGLERIGRHDNFFELGGHSLLAVQLLGRLRQQLNLDVNLRALFDHSELAAFAAAAGAQRSAANGAIVPADRSAALPLSFAQQRLWVLDQLDRRAGAAYHIPAALRLQGRLNSAALQAALDRLVARHEVLRTTFGGSEGNAMQRIGAEDAGFVLSTLDLTSMPGHEREAAVAMHSLDEASQPFDLAQGPLIRGRLLRLAEDEHILLVTQHHIISDGWSVRVMVREVSTLYAAFAAGQPDPLPPLPVQYADYAAWQRATVHGDAMQSHAAWWARRLADAPALLELPADRPRPLQQSHAGNTLPVALPAALCADLNALARRHNVTLFNVLLAGWAAVLSRLSGQRDLVIGSPVANRQRAELEGLIGFFVNTLPLRVQLEAGQAVGDLLAQVQRSTLDAYEHQDLPFDQIVEAVQPVRSMAHAPLFQVMLSLNNTPGSAALELPGLRITPVAQPNGSAQVDLSLELTEHDGAIDGTLTFATDLFDAATAQRLAAYFTQLLVAMAADDTQAVESLPLMDAPQRKQLLQDFNASAIAYPRDSLVHTEFERWAATAPDAVALDGPQGPLSYAELNRRANRLAHHLISLGVRADDRVAICAERSVDVVVGLLGILKAGAGYVPLDPAYPAERLALMLDDCAPAAVLAQAAHAASLPPSGAPLVLLDGADAAAIAAQPEHNPDAQALGLHAQRLAYVIYTSGSTGVPNGVQVEHRNVLRLAVGGGFAPIAAGDCLAHCASPSFDASTWELWGALLQGARVLLVPQEVLLSAPRLNAALLQGGVTHMWLTVGLFNEYVDALEEAFGQLRYLMIGGDALDPHTVRRALSKARRPQHLVNGYGPTETTTFAATFDIAAVPEGARSLPIGGPIGNTQLYILDSRMQPVPLGAPGELYIGGDGVARGYLKRDALSAERFVANPFGAAESRLYKTGDLARWLPDGTVDFLGRNDQQVKIRGFRIEPGEIEARLAALAGVREAVVLAREDMPGEKRLVAYVAAEQGVQLDAGSLRTALASQLAAYMVPAAIMLLEAFPLTANGKLDRRALPTPDRSAIASAGYEAPQGGTEQAIAAIWQELLGLERIGRHDNFFELGGHSLLVVSLIERLRRSGWQADVRTVFSAPTPAGIAAQLGSQVQTEPAAGPGSLVPSGCQAITPQMLPLAALSQADIDAIATLIPGGAANIQDIYSLAPLQEGILFHHLLESAGDPYLLRTAMSFDNRARLDGFLAALQGVIARHDILRTAVLWEGLEHPVQVVCREACLPVHEVAPAGEGSALVRLLAEVDPARMRLDLRRAPLFVAYVTEDGASGKWHLALLYHHLVADHVTLEFVIAEVRAFLEGREAELPRPVPYRHFIAQTRDFDSAAQEAWFRQRLGDIEEGTTPFNLLKVGAGVEEARLELDDALAQAIRDTARQHGVTPAVLFHVAWARVLGLCTGRDDVVFGTVLLGRMQGAEGADQVLGMFINTLPLRLSLQGDAAGAVRACYRELGELLAHEQTPLSLAQRCSAVPAPMPLFTTLLNYRHSHGGAAQAEWEGMQVHAVKERITYPIGMSINDIGSGFSISALCDGVDPARMAGMLVQALDALTAALARDPGLPLARLQVLPAAERQQVLEHFNDTAAAYPRTALLHQAFEAQAAARPDAPALRCGAENLSYGELNARANRLAHRLRALGVGANQRVAICVERGVDMVAGLLAILKAGAGYVPLDPAYPAERIAYMLADSKPAVLLTQSALRGLLPESELPAQLHTILLDDCTAELAGQPATDPAPAARHDSLAYVIYTSGSTGLPKGVMIEHRQAVNFIAWALREFPREQLQRTLFATSINFDLHVFELYAPLSAGAAIHLARDVLAPGSVGADVSLINTVPSTIQALLDMKQVPASVQTVNLAGEPLKRALVERLFAETDVDVVANLYGPSETTTYSTWVRMERAQGFLPHIGRPIANTQVYIVDRQLQPVPVGAVGELYIGGDGVARGYMERADLSAERFLPDPFHAATGARMYKTGDLGRWLPDGNIEYLGRNDFQVKIRGFRIELGEIEARLAACEGVREAVVLAREDQPGDKRLVAYAVAQEGAELSAAALRARLAEGLAEFMVPSAFVLLAALPLTPNGKLDRKALPAPDLESVVSRGYEAPRDAVEETLAAIWSELLGIEQVGRNDHFFELGGHSLLAVQMMGRIREQCRVEAALKELFERPVLSQLAALVTEMQLARFLEQEGASLQQELSGLSESELLAILAEEGLTDE